MSRELKSIEGISSSSSSPTHSPWSSFNKSPRCSRPSRLVLSHNKFGSKELRMAAAEEEAQKQHHQEEEESEKERNNETSHAEALNSCCLN